ncbi:MAG: hypothetical protein KF756_01690 [Acidobacteria bacterium]|nr:hypothetical protein [Acidobacteriota bacterium]
MQFKNVRLIVIAVLVGVVLLVPLVAMRFTDEVKWNWLDFVVAGALLLSAGLACEIVLRAVAKASYRLLLCVGILAVLILVWAELAVGIFGTPLAGS